MVGPGRLMVGRMELYRRFVGIPGDEGRSIMVTSTAMFTTLEDLDRFVAALDRIAHGTGDG